MTERHKETLYMFIICGYTNSFFGKKKQKI